MSKLTKRVRVTFEMTAVIDEESLYADIVEAIKAGQHKTGRAAYVLAESLEGGLEAAAGAILKSAMPELLKDSIRKESKEEFSLKLGNVSTRVIR